ncbi:MAG: M12 family metallo-peptidase, partial [Gammaproteobacteria bacterium]|nr:M12 family metallo-peptidase [Gammaproteobacteria bacterium]
MALNTISVIASDPFAVEAQSLGTFVVSRTGDTSHTLTVQYTLSGTATEGVDYKKSDGTITFDPDISSVPVIINPFNDQIADGTETVTLSIKADPDFDLNLSSATLNIRDQFDGAGIDAVVPLDETFELSSLPDANHTIYLEFRGGNYYVFSPMEDEATAYYVAPYNTDGSAGLSDKEKAEIQIIWKSVAEDFLPFNINVTTKYPGLEALRKTDENDQQWGTTTLIGEDPGLGFAWSGGEFWSKDNYPGYVSYKNIDTGSIYPPVQLAAAVSHEVGHTMGLVHDDTIYNPGGYYEGHYAGSDYWYPIMAKSALNLSQWSKGNYPGAKDHQDDLAIIASVFNGFGYKADDHSDQSRQATDLVV